MNNSTRPTAKLHIAIFARSLSGGGGVERVVLQLAGALAERGHQIDIILARTKGPFLAELPAAVNLVELHAPAGIFAIPLLLRRPRWLRALLPVLFVPGVAQVLGAIPSLVRYLKRAQPDVLLGALDYANITALLAREFAAIGKLRTVASVHNHMSSAVANAERPHLSRLVPLARTFYPLADAIVCVSDGVADDLAATLDLDRGSLSTIYNPVITPSISVLAGAALEHPWFAAGEPPVLLAVGKLRKQKDFPTLLHAFARVRQTHAARLLILGEGPDRADLLRLVDTLALGDDVALVGFDRNPYRFMAHADVFVLSSAWEGFGNVLVEAMACGCPVVSTNCPSGPAEILADGEFGTLVEVGKPDELAAGIIETLTLPRANAARIERAKQFSAAASAAAYEVLFEKLLETSA